jgi:Ca2+-transporting ATPase
MQHYLSQPETVFESLGSSPDGLSAEQAQQRLCDNGPNKLAEGKKTPVIVRFFQQMKDPMILILLAAALISGVTAVIEGESFADVIIILTVVIINAVLGVVQESKAEKAIEALQKMSAATCKVLRGGQPVRIKTEELVVGDVYPAGKRETRCPPTDAC